MDVLRSFLNKKDKKVLEEYQWLRDIGADCVLSDAAFLGWYVPALLLLLSSLTLLSLAAHHAGIPSVLITNFSFESVYSYLSTSFIDAPSTPEKDVFGLPAQPPSPILDLPPDIPISQQTLAPLVDEIVSGFRCADLLLRLPGAIPMPSFSVVPGLPSSSWVDHNTSSFTEEVKRHLKEPLSSHELYSSLDFPDEHGPKPLARSALSAPLLVRSPNSSIYTAEGRCRLLNIIGVPPYMHDPNHTKILIVSFGGQVFRKPSSRIHSRSPSRTGTPGAFAAAVTRTLNGIPREIPMSKPSDLSREYFPDPDKLAAALRSTHLSNTPAITPVIEGTPSFVGTPGLPPPKAMMMARASSLKIPGAPPMSPSRKTSSKQGIPAVTTIPPSPMLIRQASRQDAFLGWSMSAEEQEMEEEYPCLLPDETWIAVVCGVSKEWGKENGEELPPGFYVAPRDIYMPDLTAAADVLLGKLVRSAVSHIVGICMLIFLTGLRYCL